MEVVTTLEPESAAALESGRVPASKPMDVDASEIDVAAASR